MDQRIIDLYDEYTHAPLDRRVFLERLGRMVGGSAAAAVLAAQLQANYAEALTIAPDDARLIVETIQYPGAGVALQGYLARPRDAADRLPAVIVVHENRGLNGYVEDVTRRLGLAGFLALAPDLLAPLGGTPADEDMARQMIGKLDSAQTVANLRATLSHLKGHSHSTGRVGVVGFCWGGGMANQLAVHAPDLMPAVVFYGPPPAPADVPRIKAPLLLHYAGLDARINAGVPAFEEALKAAGTNYTLHMYPDVNHAFHNDAAGPRYDAAAAQTAWLRTLAFLNETLRN